MAEDRKIEAEVTRIIKDQLDVDEKDIRPESTFIDDLGADSLGLVELVLAFEEAFEIDIPDEDTEKIRTVQDFVDEFTKAGILPQGLNVVYDLASRSLRLPVDFSFLLNGAGGNAREHFSAEIWRHADIKRADL